MTMPVPSRSGPSVAELRAFGIARTFTLTMASKKRSTFGGAAGGAADFFPAGGEESAAGENPGYAVAASTANAQIAMRIGTLKALGTAGSLIMSVSASTRR